MAIRTINWPATVAAVQAILNGTNPRPTQATINSGVVIRNALSAAGATYDTASNDGVSNTSAYALSVQAWAATTAPLWVETDRVARAAYKLTPPPTDLLLAAFGMPGLQPWRKSTTYGQLTAASPAAAVVPTPSNGFNYIQVSGGGASGAVQPAFPTTPGAAVVDGSSGIVWECAAPITGPSGGQPIALPWDVTLVNIFVLTARVTYVLGATQNSPGLFSLVQNQSFALNFAVLAQPAANPSADAASLSAINALNVAIANANAWIAAAAIQ